LPSHRSGRAWQSPPERPRSRAWLTLAAVTLVCACNSSPRGETDAQVQARLKASAQRALAALVPNAQTARYANLRSGSQGAICGEVEAAGRGVLHPFLVTPDGTAMVAVAPTVRLDQPGDRFADLYVQYCASVEELAAMARRGGEPGSAADNLAADLNFLPTQAPVMIDDNVLMPVPDVPAADEPSVDEEPAARPAPAAPRGGDDSFYNAIMRAPPEAAPRR
jgi:hypothetical protein